MPFCPECGTEVNEGDRFCPGCGAGLEGLVPPETTEPTAAAAEAAAIGEGIQAREEAPPSEEEESQAKEASPPPVVPAAGAGWRKKTKLLAALGVAVVVIAVVAIMVGGKSNPVASYAEEKGLPPATVQSLEPLGSDDIMDENEAAFIDMLANYAEWEQCDLAALMVADERISDEELFLLGQSLSSPVIEALLPLCDGGIDEGETDFVELLRGYPKGEQMKLAAMYVPNPEQALAEYALCEAAHCCYQDGQYGAAINKYDDFFSRYPDSLFVSGNEEEEIAECYYRLGVQLQSEGNFEAAVSKYGKVTSCYPDTRYVPDAQKALDACIMLDQCQDELHKKQYDSALNWLGVLLDDYEEFVQSSRDYVADICDGVLTACTVKGPQEEAAIMLLRIYGDADVLLPYLKKQATVIVYAPLIKVGQADTEDTLIKALNDYGYKGMVVDYLNCGNDRLEKAATTWAYGHGYRVVTTPGASGAPAWGSGI